MIKSKTAQDLVAQKQELIEAHLNKISQDFQCPAMLKEAMTYSLLAGGKRFRPLLVLASAELAGLDEEIILPMACAMEMIHTYSLIHDDLPAMDNDNLRRGKPTSHKMFGEAMAILAGDALLNEAMLLLMQEYGGSTTGAAAIADIARSSGKDGMIAGQVLDIQSEGQTIDMKTLEEMHQKKTGAIITSSLTAPFLLAGKPTREVQELVQFGLSLGILFQIQDDILDVESNAETMGKTVGKDARDDKSTYVSILGLDPSKTRLKELNADLKAFAILNKPSGSLLEAIVEVFAKRDH
ncbi:MAG: polyprenyl synthetase family protein [Clostridium sp.]|nr:polyprenyl synthetase family protein [Clostridium sp.]